MQSNVTQNQLNIPTLSGNPINVEAFSGRAVLNDVAQLQRKYEDETDHAIVNDAVAKLSHAANDVLYGSKGLQTKLGENAAKAKPELLADYQAKVSEISPRIKNNRQLNFFNDAVKERRMFIEGAVTKHQASESKRQIDLSYKSLIQSQDDNLTKNYNNPTEVATSLKKIDFASTEHAKTAGLDPESTKQYVISQKSGSIRGAIEVAIDSGDINTATSLFETYKDDSMTAKDINAVTKPLAASKLKSDAFKEADRIKSMGGTLTESFKEARKITNLPLRDAVIGQLKSDASDDEYAKKLENERKLKEAYVQVDKQGYVNPVLLSSLDADEYKAAQSYRTSKIDRNRSIKKDNEVKDATLLKVHEAMHSDPDKFAKMNLLELVPYIGFPQYEKLLAKQNKIKNGTETSLDKTVKNMKPIYIEKYKISKDDKAAFYTGFDDAISDFQSEKGRAPSKEELKSIADALTVELIMPGVLWDSTKPIYQASASEVNRADATISPKSIPFNDYNRIKTSLIKGGLPYSDNDIRDYYFKKYTIRGKKVGI